MQCTIFPSEVAYINAMANANINSCPGCKCIKLSEVSCSRALQYDAAVAEVREVNAVL